MRRCKTRLRCPLDEKLGLLRFRCGSQVGGRSHSRHATHDIIRSCFWIYLTSIAPIRWRCPHASRPSSRCAGRPAPCHRPRHRAQRRLPRRHGSPAVANAGPLTRGCSAAPPSFRRFSPGSQSSSRCCFRARPGGLHRDPTLRVHAERGRSRPGNLATAALPSVSFRWSNQTSSTCSMTYLAIRLLSDRPNRSASPHRGSGASA